jgi:stress-induced morphogen
LFENGGTSLIAPEEIRTKIQAALPDSEVTVRDLTGGGDHYEVQVVSKAFAGVSPIQRHRMVYAPLKDVLGGALHALALKTQTPDEAVPGDQEEAP